MESLRDSIRQYDSFSGGLLRMHGGKVYSHQYMQNKAGNLHHVDNDMVELMPPPIKKTMKKNYAVLLGAFAGFKKGDPCLDCIMGYWEQNNDVWDSR
jgi:hypothetical protein